MGAIWTSKVAGLLRQDPDFWRAVTYVVDNADYRQVPDSEATITSVQGYKVLEAIPRAQVWLF